MFEQNNQTPSSLASIEQKTNQNTQYAEIASNNAGSCHLEHDC